MGIKSTYEYLNLRFGNATRLMAVIAFLIQTMLYLGIVIYAPALALSKTTGMNLWGAVVGTGVICTAYTTLGGMKAVIWTGVFQGKVTQNSIGNTIRFFNRTASPRLIFKISL